MWFPWLISLLLFFPPFWSIVCLFHGYPSCCQYPQCMYPSGLHSLLANSTSSLGLISPPPMSLIISTGCFKSQPWTLATLQIHLFICPLKLLVRYLIDNSNSKNKLNFHSWLFRLYIHHRSLNKSLFQWLGPLPVMQTRKIYFEFILFLASQLIIETCFSVTICTML